MSTIRINDEISYDFSKRMFHFIHPKHNNVAQYYLMSQEERNKISKLSKPSAKKTSKNTLSILMI